MPSLGIPQLDTSIGTLFWGENVMWLAESSTHLRPVSTDLIRRAEHSGAYDQRVVIGGAATAGAVALEAPAPGSGRDGVAALMDRLRDTCAGHTSGLVCVHLDDASVATGTASGDHDAAWVGAVAKFVLERGLIGLWFVARDVASRQTEQTARDLGQCVFELSADQIRLVKADGRHPGLRGTVFRYATSGDGITVSATPAASRLGRGLRRLRKDHGWTQGDLGRIAGVSTSAISQAERGVHALSLETLIDLTTRAGITLDELLLGTGPADYVLARWRESTSEAESGAWLLLDDAEAGLRVMLLQIPPNGSASPGTAGHDGNLLLVARGLIQVILSSDRPILREGEAISTRNPGMLSARNLGDSHALVFWILRRSA